MQMSGYAARWGRLPPPRIGVRGGPRRRVASGLRAAFTVQRHAEINIRADVDHCAGLAGDRWRRPAVATVPPLIFEVIRCVTLSRGDDRISLVPGARLRLDEDHGFSDRQLQRAIDAGKLRPVSIAETTADARRAIEALWR